MQHSEPAICGSETVLVAEDDLHVRNLTVAVLKACGYSVLELENPSEAERVCEQHSGVIDLLLTDVIMRDMSGTRARDAKAAPADQSLIHVGIHRHGDRAQGCARAGHRFSRQAIYTVDISGEGAAGIGPSEGVGREIVAD
jgi:CheY-like chemotaxis protein